MFLRIQLNTYILIILLMYLTVSTNMDKTFYVCYSEHVKKMLAVLTLKSLCNISITLYNGIVLKV